MQFTSKKNNFFNVLTYLYLKKKKKKIPVTGRRIVADSSLGSGSKFIGFPLAWLEGVAF